MTILVCRAQSLIILMLSDFLGVPPFFYYQHLHSDNMQIYSLLNPLDYIVVHDLHNQSLKTFAPFPDRVIVVVA